MTGRKVKMRTVWNCLLGMSVSFVRERRKCQSLIILSEGSCGHHLSNAFEKSNGKAFYFKDGTLFSSLAAGDLCLQRLEIVVRRFLLFHGQIRV